MRFHDDFRGAGAGGHSVVQVKVRAGAASDPFRACPCPCPNDHVRLDRGSIYISNDLIVYDSLTDEKIGPLSRNNQHVIDTAHIDYHRNLWIDIGDK